MERKEQICISIDKDMLVEIDRLAKQLEDQQPYVLCRPRNRSWTIRKLLSEALDARAKAETKDRETSSDCDTVITTPPVRGIDFFDVSDLGSGEEITKELESRGVHPSDVISIGDGINTCRIWYRI